MKHFGSFALDTGNECIWQHGAQLALAPKPFAVLRYMVENPGRLITHDELLDSLWPKTYVQPQVLRTYMLELRKVLGDDAGNPLFIQTVPKRGFRFVAPVSDCPPSEPKTPHTLNQAPASTESDLHESQANEIVGRDEEFTHLKKLAEQTGSGQRQMVFVTGEVGIGKTALVDAFSHWARSAPLAAGPANLARGQCVEGFGAKEEYYPVMEALHQLCASADGEIACRILSTLAPAWQTAQIMESAVSPNHERMPGDLCAALEELSAVRPLILVFEDLHWADESTLHLLSALARRRAPAQLMILATYRPQDGAGRAMERPLKSIKQDLLMRRLCCEMPLSPLGKPAMKVLLTRELQQDALPPGLATFVHRHSEGNPLFAIAILEHLIAQQFLVRRAGGWEQHAPFQEMEAGVPDGLAKMIELEMERLSPVEQCLLEAGSLIQVAFPAWAVAAALGKDPEETEELCDVLARKLYFLERAGQDELPDGTCSAFYVFAHGLFREVLYRRQSSSRRAQRHIRIAEKLGELFRGREANVARDVAMHFEAAGSIGRAVDALRTAAHHAQQRNAHADAVELLERALRIVENLDDSAMSASLQLTADEIRQELKQASDFVGGRSRNALETSTKA